jgi:ribosomal silencing factor RsfS
VAGLVSPRSIGLWNDVRASACRPVRVAMASFSNHNPPGTVPPLDHTIISGTHTVTPPTPVPADSNSTAKSTVLSDEWVPPSRPLSGDQGFTVPDGDTTDQETVDDALLFVIEEGDSEADIQRKLDAVLRLEEELEQKALERELQQEEAAQRSPPEPPVDWLATRRAALGARQEASKQAIPVRTHELLTEDELLALLEYHNGEDIQVLLDNPDAPRMGGAIGMVVCEASGGGFHIQSITRALVDHLKERRLQDLGVLGAQMGSNRSMYQHSTWNVVDCQNFIVHILSGPTRRALRLEELWSGRDPLWRLDVSNDDHVDDYVAKNPVPADYYGSGGGGSLHEARGNWNIGKLERSPFVPHSPVIPTDKKHQDRRAGRRKRREMKQGY